MRNYSLRNTRWVCRGHELDYIASIILQKDNAFYLIGNKKEVLDFFGRLDRFIEDWNVKGIVLTEYEDDTSELMGIPIVHDRDIEVNKCNKVICVSYERAQYTSVRDLFSNYGYEENINFFQGEVFCMIFEVYALDKITLDRIEIFMTSHCSLNCKNCIAYIPYFKERGHVDLDVLKEDADLLFSKVDKVNKYKVLGGEGLAYPYLYEFLEYVCSHYRDKIGTIRIGTNGTIIPSDKLLSLCKKYRIIMDISDYTCAIGARCKLDEVKSICESNGVSVDVKRTGEQWLDLGFPHNLPNERNEQQLKKHFFNCAMFCRNFHKGKLFFCCSNFAATLAGLFKEDSNDYFDFRSDFSKKELLEYELGFSNLGHTTFCKVCRGCSDEVNPFHVEVAKQVGEK